MSSNPFRKKTLEAIDTTRAQSPVKSSLRSDSPLGGDGAMLGKPRTVKKVRVLSPPPLSPDSPEWPANVSRSAYADSLYRDPFGVGWSTDESGPDTAAITQPPPAVPAAVPTGNVVLPANPFSKTLQAPEDTNDLENQRKSEGAALKAGNMARQSLNVDSFKRLLLTGKVGDTEALLATDSPAINDYTTGGDEEEDIPHVAPRQVTPTSSQVPSVPPSPTPQSDIDRSGPSDLSAALAQHEAHLEGARLASLPPRPPTRNPSVKRPASVVSVEGLSRRVSAESKARDGLARPPPPPPRQRGSSSGSLDALPRRMGAEAHSALGQKLRVSSSGGTAKLGEEQAAPESGKGDDILADLDELQREVDALRGQIA
ncbi:hypothetical protein OCS_00513 [Ophiocordyceps sinensis CO18]|uniref:Uncharacterized protein n=1 Tax=Ophiocordyceps sinensis (strain Co18 / CGMCC 3.14243) TaxID=911162 RepID=T5AEA0_OPHSC|nr:hypothetical protein OCS_00513 [Ophiocordyceps sinensis CO18]